MAEDFNRLFAQVRSFGWDDEKRDKVLLERGIDFQELRFLFEGPTVAHRSDRGSEARYMVFGFLDDLELTVVCTIRADVCWIITARRAKKNERKEHHNRLTRRAPSEGKD